MKILGTRLVPNCDECVHRRGIACEVMHLVTLIKTGDRYPDWCPLDDVAEEGSGVPDTWEP
jgi:hypothetical protein